MITIEVLGTKTENDQLHEVAVFIPHGIGYSLVTPDKISDKEVAGVLYVPVKTDDQEAREAIRQKFGLELYVFRMRFELEKSFMWDSNVVGNKT
jgi:hypothetical protein